MNNQCSENFYITDANLPINIFSLLEDSIQPRQGKECKFVYEYETNDGGKVQIGTNYYMLTPADINTLYILTTYRQETGLRGDTFEIPIKYIMEKRGLDVTSSENVKLVLQSLDRLMMTKIVVERYGFINNKTFRRDLAKFTLLPSYRVSQKGSKGRGYKTKLTVTIAKEICNNLDNGYVARGNLDIAKQLIKYKIAHRIYNFLMGKCTRNKTYKRNFAQFVGNDICPELPLDEGKEKVINALIKLESMGLINYKIDKDVICINIHK
ncbi:hypothetical protein [Caldicellulosiruptor morganii]|uniref:Uncharacterized protein n=1 Tax=Caldicellulosiruptor morganii TaxID=1387555 RepID=A0ABY7BNY3_9FIRM|nr:hypothetical protein [Caldicellulosiruptor morganii]WAM34510.1 hypothetical protein OTK00_000717 [Caldicellulosiruptor morganii]